MFLRPSDLAFLTPEKTEWQLHNNHSNKNLLKVEEHHLGARYYYGIIEDDD
jgi:hypothetical protein